MTTTFSTANLKEVFSFPFKDEKWVSKLGILLGMVFFSFLLFPAFIYMGYLYEIMRRIIVQREAPSLPEWDDWGEYLMKGIRMWGVSLVYSLPTFVFMAPYMVMMFVMPFIADQSDVGPLQVILLMGSMFLFFAGMFVSLVTWIFLMPAWGHMVAKDEFAAAFRFKEFWPVLRNNLMGYLLSIVIYFGLVYLVTMVSQLLMITIILCVLYPVVLMFSSAYMSLVVNVLFAQAYVDGAEAVTAKAALLEAETPAAEDAEEENA